MLSVGVVIVLLLVLGIWILIEIRKMKHKLFAIFLIALILFAYVTFSMTIKDKDVDLKTVDGLAKATKIYFSWLGSAFLNLKSLTTNAIKMNWTGENKDIQKNITQA
jgi:glucan phosphoethanolaminetransferase (alkaline phosphatase superfamily)